MSVGDSQDLGLLTDNSDDYSSGEEIEEDTSVDDDTSSKVKQFTESTKKRNSEDFSNTSYRTLSPGEGKPFTVTPFFWIMLLGCASIPIIIVVSHLCETGDSLICENVRKVFNSVAPGFQYFSKRYTSLDDHNSVSYDSASGYINGDGSETKSSSLPWLKEPIKNARLLTDDEIKYVEDMPLYLVIIGHVFDVTEGKSYYAPGTGYFGFIGKDGSRAFVSGEFNEKGLVDDIDGLSASDYLGLLNWIKFYFDKYTFVGYHIGRFFDKSGKETSYLTKFKGFVKAAETEEEAEQDLRKMFPPCNVAWSSEQGSRVWCTNQSGGIKRDWVGLPREFYETKKEARCSCVHPNLLSDPRVRQYPNCDPQSNSCVPPQPANDKN